MLQANPRLTAETRTLLKYFDDQRNHVLGILRGLSDDDLRRPVLPSGWSCLALVQHLTLDVERFWYSGVVAGNPSILDTLAEDPDGAWRIAPGISPDAVFDAYRQEIERSNAVIVATPLDSPPGLWPDGLFGDWRLDTVREVVLHGMTETAAHAGHLDAARELIDGKLWLVLTGASPD